MRRQVAANYTPEYQVIRFKGEFRPDSDADSNLIFETDHQAGFFIHEWMHYLHNISTFHGMAAYSHAITIWSNARNLLFESKELSEALIAERTADIQRQNQHRLAARSEKGNDLPPSLKLSDLRFNSWAVNFVDLQGDVRYRCSEVVCDVEVNARSEQGNYRVLIGNHEIVEFVAYKLEEKFLRHRGEFPLQAEVVPYLLVKGFASLIAPDLSDETVIRCALLALQHTDPPGFLPGILSKAQSVYDRSMDPDERLECAAKVHLKDNQKPVVDTIELLEKMFPVDEPMAYAVRYAAEKMRSNYECRLEAPFFEIDLVEHLADVEKRAAALEKHGVGFLIQENLGDEDLFGRDLLRELHAVDVKNPTLSEGRKVAHGAIHYIFGLFSEGLETLAHPTIRRCPFYTCCKSDFRRDHGEQCKTTPWVTKDLKLEEICFYGRAVLNTMGEDPKPIVMKQGDT